MSAQDPTVSTESNGSALVVTACVMLSLTWFSVSLRTYVRGFMTNGFLADDFWMLASQANFTVSCAFILRGCYHGLGRHNKSLSVYNEINSLKWQALATATYILNMWLIKMSIGLFLLRIATQKRYRYTLYGALGVVTVWSLVLFFWNIFQCNPVEAQWDLQILANDPNARCVSPEEVVKGAYALSVMTILSDWLFALLPIPMVWSVKMSLQAKVTVMAVLGVGVFASIATLVRLKFLSDLTDLEDILFAGTDAMVWTLIEPGLAIVASSLATIRPLLRALGIKGFQLTERSRSGMRSGKQQSRTGGTGQNRGMGMPGFGSEDVTLVDMEGGLSRSDTNRKSRSGGSSVYDNNTLSNSTSSKGQSPKTAVAMVTVEEREEKDSERCAAMSSPAGLTPLAKTPATTEAPASNKKPKMVGHKKKPTPVRVEPGPHRLEIQRTTSITQTTTTTSSSSSHHSLAPPVLTSKYSTSMIKNGLSVQDLEQVDARQNGTSIQGRTFLASDQSSLSSMELATMEPEHNDEESPLPNGLSSRRK
ncbi:uncharacterized protein B0I36DRAFT_383072 [Microdochium trichocladiopsis]|uniref:Rhodopsin domain-containing protein n=1 Tax=Microdochium trichocladiopsis TaxID=1682393 RepID=A0A9P8Y6Q8_9PEZI|nr:uncharacterized protein B0I36DRAFT_383072 [Microdochium trichocladiopsis]KAH7033150.1 hypothetical protein B0I36DRAFT_383072 [Microdochium trichocladiopsis]